MDSEGILGIRNRTENWKTARVFVPLLAKGAVHRLAERLSGRPVPGPVKMELFWRGMRDYVHQNGYRPEDLLEPVAAAYRRCFADLHDEVARFSAFQELKDYNYRAPISESSAKKLADNLINTEVDVVLETPGYLFIGEAKHEMNFDTNSSLVVVHQLIRQYVMARVLLDLQRTDYQVVPFVVADKCKLRNVERNGQVRFLVGKEWLKKENILPWEMIAPIACG